ncbi:MAG: PKD-like family lipoprotein [Rikenellaceae bacterium]|nr:PKD-like family lipoprotein [Rikenellaceae bacterium]MCL2693197.1 PKD-like family lipoprotein [Rikenellaceae bacterium]
MKKKTFVKCLSFLLAAMLFIASCYEDKGNYDYIELNRITFSGIEPYYNIQVGAPLTIKPMLEQTLLGNEINFQYIWLRLRGGSWDTIHREKYIDDISLPQLTGGRVHPLVYQVLDYTHTVNGRPVTYTSDVFRIQVNNDIRQGFMLLLDDDGETDLRFLNYLSGGNATPDRELQMRTVPRSENLPEHLGRPLNIVCYADNNAPAPGGRGVNGVDLLYAVSLVTENGIFRYSHDLLDYEPTYNARYVIVGGSSDVDAIRFSDLVVPSNKTQQNSRVNAMIRTAEGNFMFHVFGQLVMVEMGLGTYIPWEVGIYCNRYRAIPATGDTPAIPPQRFTPFEMPAYAGAVAVFYDMDNRRFAFRGGTAVVCDPITAAPTLFPYNNTPFEPVWMFMAPSYAIGATNYSNVVHAIVRDRATGEMDQISFSISSATNATQLYKNRLWPVADEGEVLPGINQATLFALNHDGVNFRNLLFWAYGGSIYSFDISTGMHREVFTAPVGETVVGMKVIVNQITSATGTWNNDFRDHMVVATKGSGPNSTSVGIYEVTPMYGNLTLKELTNADGTIQECIWTGLPDYVGIDWKAK